MGYVTSSSLSFPICKMRISSPLSGDNSCNVTATGLITYTALNRCHMVKNLENKRHEIAEKNSLCIVVLKYLEGDHVESD